MNRSKKCNFKKKSYADKVAEAIVPGCPSAVNVVDGNLKAALRQLKQIQKERGDSAQLKRKRYFTPKSEVIRKNRDYARYINMKESKR